MRLKFRMGRINVANHGKDHYAIKLWNSFDNTHSTINFLTRDQLKQVRNAINTVLSEEVKNDDRTNAS